MATDKTDEKETPTKRGVGRPKFKFDWVKLEEVCRLNPTDDEIAVVFGCTRQTVAAHKNEKKFKEARARGEAHAKTSLRRLMWQSAEGAMPEIIKDGNNQPIMLLDRNRRQHIAMTEGREPNITMQIWLSKNLLGYTDKQEVTGAGGEALFKSVHFILPNGKEVPCQPAKS